MYEREIRGGRGREYTTESPLYLVGENWGRDMEVSKKNGMSEVERGKKWGTRRRKESEGKRRE